jgi:hypothetical protein
MSQTEDTCWEKTFLTTEEFAEFEVIKNSRTPEEWAEYHTRWLALLAKVNQNLQDDPGSQKSQQLAKEWVSIVEEIYGDHLELGDKMWSALKSGSMPNTDFPYTQELILYITNATDILKIKSKN